VKFLHQGCGQSATRNITKVAKGTDGSRNFGTDMRNFRKPFWES